MFAQSAIPFYLVIVNFYVFVLMGIDKYKAQQHHWRIPESNILFMGVIGGGIGGILGQFVFHHKTRKKKFFICFTIGILTAVFLFLLR